MGWSWRQRQRGEESSRVCAFDHKVVDLPIALGESPYFGAIALVVQDVFNNSRVDRSIAGLYGGGSQAQCNTTPARLYCNTSCRAWEYHACKIAEEVARPVFLLMLILEKKKMGGGPAGPSRPPEGAREQLAMTASGGASIRINKNI